MKFYYPEWKKEEKVIVNIEGIEIPCRAQDVKETAMYLRLKHGEYVRFVDHFGNKVGKDYPVATPYGDSGFSLISHQKDKDKYLDIFMRESDSPTSSGIVAYSFFQFLYTESKNIEDVKEELKQMDYKHFVDKIYYEGIIKMLIKYLRDLVQAQYDEGKDVTCEQILRNVLSEFKTICDEKRDEALKEQEKINAIRNRRKNGYNASVKFLDSFKIEDSEDERKMVCVNEEDVEEYDM